MKLKSILSISSVFVLLAVLVSSCGSMLNITKKRHSNGYYVSIGNDYHKGKTKADSKRNSKKDVAALIENKSKENNLAINLEGSQELNQENEKTGAQLQAENLNAEQQADAEEFSKMSTLKKIKALKQLKKQSKADDNADIALMLLVLLAILLPPVAVYMKRGVGTPFWISIILTLLFWLPGIIYALLIVFDAI